MSNKKQQIPDIRFKGFTDDWEQRKLGEVSEITKLAGFEFTKYIKYSDTGHIPAIRGLNVKNGNFVFNDVKYIDESDFSKLSRSKLFAGDIVFTYVGTIGEAAIIPENVTWYLAPNVSRIRTTELNPTFLLQLLINPVFRRKEIETWIATSSQPALSMENIRKFEMNIPSHKEQTKIGKFFNNLDKTIALHQRQLNNYKEFKGAMLQKMFPQNGKKLPEVRFYGFTEEWEHFKLGELVDVTTGKLDANAMKDNGKYDFYTSGIKKYKIDVAAFEGPAITIAGNGATVGYMHYADGKFNAYQRTYILTKFKANREFLFSEIKRNLPKKINQEARTGNIPYIVLDMLTDLQIKVPSSEEQIKIGAFFKHLDDTIAFHQQKVNDYKQLKNAMLQQLFV